MKLYILDNGQIEGSGKIFYDESHPESSKNIVFPVSVFLIITDEGKKILFDLGVYPGGIRAASTSYRYMDKSQTIESQLALAGLTTRDIDRVILSHLHYDHAGNLFLFKNKDIYVSQTEYDYAFSMPGGAYTEKDYDIENIKWHLIKEDGPIFDGIDAVMLPGHTPGMMGLVVHLESGSVILAQDSVYRADNYYPGLVVPGLIGDVDSYKKSVAKVKSLQEKYNRKVIFGHDPRQTKELKHRPEYYE